jgi:hypothetical protein
MILHPKKLRLLQQAAKFGHETNQQGRDGYGPTNHTRNKGNKGCPL